MFKGLSERQKRFFECALHYSFFYFKCQKCLQKSDKYLV